MGEKWEKKCGHRVKLSWIYFFAIDYYYSISEDNLLLTYWKTILLSSELSFFELEGWMFFLKKITDIIESHHYHTFSDSLWESTHRHHTQGSYTQDWMKNKVEKLKYGVIS